MPTIVELTAASISMDEGNSFYTGAFTLANYLDANKFEQDTPFTFTVGGVETYNFVVDSKSFEKGELGAGVPFVVTLNCLSPSVVLAAPRAVPITRTWTTGTALNIANDVLDLYPFKWDIMDWPIPSNLYSVTLQTPLEIVKKLAETVGGVVESLPDGSLLVRYKFPVSVLDYQNASPDHTIIEAEEVINGKESQSATKVLNKFRVSDTNVAVGADKMEFLEVSPGSGRGILFVYPHAWRTPYDAGDLHGFKIVAGGQNVNKCQYLGVHYRHESQVVEFIKGKASLTHPVFELDSVTWLSAIPHNSSVDWTVDLPTITIVRALKEDEDDITDTEEVDPVSPPLEVPDVIGSGAPDGDGGTYPNADDTLFLNTQNYFLARVRYRVRAHIWEVFSGPGQKTDFLMVDPYDNDALGLGLV